MTAPGGDCGFTSWGSTPASAQVVQRDNLLSPSLPLPPGDAFALTPLKNLNLLEAF